MQYGASDFYDKFSVQKKTFDHMVFMVEAARRDEEGVLLSGNEMGVGDKVSMRMLGLLWLLRFGGDPHAIPFIHGDCQPRELEKAADAIIATCTFMVSLISNITEFNELIDVLFYRSALTSENNWPQRPCHSS